VENITTYDCLLSQ